MSVSQSPIRFAWQPASIGLTLTLIATPLAAKPASADVLARAVSGPLRCEIQKSQSGDIVKLIGLAAGTQPVGGTSRFVMIKSGTSGSSNMTQSQHFALKAQQQAIVAEATTNLDPGGRIALDFGLKTDSGLTCNVRASLER